MDPQAALVELVEAYGRYQHDCEGWPDVVEKAEVLQTWLNRGGYQRCQTLDI